MRPGPVSDHSELIRRVWAERLSSVPGQIAEFGVFEGGTTRQLAEIMPDRTIYAFDTFEGFPAQGIDPEIDDTTQISPGIFKPTQTPAQMFEGYTNIVPMVGLFRDTIWGLPPGIQFAFVFLDCDTYSGHLDVLCHLGGTNRLSPGGGIFIEDLHYLKGARQAVDKFLVGCPAWGLNEGTRMIYRSH
jgi:O-methyltransferase